MSIGIRSLGSNDSPVISCGVALGKPPNCSNPFPDLRNEGNKRTFRELSELICMTT